MKTINIIFIILHYNTVFETENCVKSIIEKIDTDSFHILIVDNCSPNNSGKELKKKYKNNPNITVILCKDNLGFANGNNAGISFALNNFNATFICCINNDTLLEQNDFYDVLDRAYKKNRPAVIGPKIILKNGEIQKMNGSLLSVNEYERQLNQCEKVLNHDFIQSVKEILYGIKPLRKLLLSRKNKKRFQISSNDIVDYYDTEHIDVVLHGCCLIFTPIFFEKLNGFCPDTFLYQEEELLYLDVMDLNMHTLYEPNLTIRHLEDSATNSIARTPKKKREFIAKHKSNSLKILISRLKNK